MRGCDATSVDTMYICTVGGLYFATLNAQCKTRLGEVISYVSLAISPPTPSLNVESCKNVSFRRGGVIKHMFLSTTLIPGVIGDCALFLVCELYLNMYWRKVAKMFSSTVPALPRLSAS